MPVEEQYYTKARVAHKYDIYIGKNIPFYWPALRFIADHLGRRHTAVGRRVGPIDRAGRAARRRVTDVFGLGVLLWGVTKVQAVSNRGD